MSISTDFTAYGMAQKALTVTSTSTLITGTSGLAAEAIPGKVTHMALQPADGKVYWNIGTASASTALVPADGLVINAHSAPALNAVQLYSPTGATCLCTFGGNEAKLVLGGGDVESYDVGEPFALLIDESVLGSALSDPPPVATKAEVVGTAAHGIIDTRGKPIARIIFGGTNLADEAFNYQVIAWSQVSGGSGEGWVPRVIAKGLVTLGDDVYAITGFGAATNFFADTITDTILDRATVYTVAEQRAVLEVPTFGAERLEVQTDLTTAAAADCLIQFSDAPSGTGGGGGSFFFEDEAHVDGDPGSMLLCVRTDSRASLAGSDGDYAPPQLTSNGEMRVRDDDVNTDLDTIVPVVHNEDESYTAADAGIPMLAVRKDSEAQAGSAADGDYVPVQTDATGSMRVTDDTGNTRLGTNGEGADGAGSQSAQLRQISNTLVGQAVFTAPVEKTPIKCKAVIGTASTAEILADASDTTLPNGTFARGFQLQARLIAGDNTGNVFVGLSALDQGAQEMFELTPGATFEYMCPTGTKIDMNDVYVDADQNNDGVVGWYIPV